MEFSSCSPSLCCCFQTSSSNLFLERKQYWTQEHNLASHIGLLTVYHFSILSFSKFSLASRFQDHGFLVFTFFQAWLCSLSLLYFLCTGCTIPLIWGCLGLGLEPLSFPCLCFCWRLKHSESSWGERDLLVIWLFLNMTPFRLNYAFILEGFAMLDSAKRGKQLTGLISAPWDQSL